IPWGGRSRLAKALLVPIIGMLLLRFISLSSDESQGVLLMSFLFAAQILLFTIFAVTCHRLVLLGDDSVPPYGLQTWTGRETRFVGWFLELIFIFVAITILLVVPLGFMGSLLGGGDSQPLWFMYLFCIPGLYVLSRLSIILPAIAIDKREDLLWAWRVSKGNGGRLFIVAGILPVLFSLIQIIPSLYAKSLLVHILVGLLGFVLMAVEMTALSLSYQVLRKDGINATITE
ncbi:MAG: hypothetical protein JXD19_02285, partial [Deltaproteobacteria bacterium]|nr:hypothetical protein [Deltaproteobacteria bacterium]